MSRSLNVHLVEYAGALSAGSADESARVRTGIRQRLQQWFQSVVTNARARANQPAGFTRTAHVAWVPRLTAAQVDPHDLVLHFDASSVSGGRDAGPLLGPYNTALGALQDQGITVPAMSRAPSGGITRQVLAGDLMVPILSVIYVLYDAQFSNASLRISTNVERLCVIAFHEAAHNKDRSNSLHTAGGGGIFADIHTGTVQASLPNAANFAFFAERIWNWGPQYVDGASLAPQRPPAATGARTP